jgi:hypothetical protein
MKTVNCRLRFDLFMLLRLAASLSSPLLQHDLYRDNDAHQRDKGDPDDKTIAYAKCLKVGGSIVTAGVRA